MYVCIYVNTFTFFILYAAWHAPVRTAEFVCFIVPIIIWNVLCLSFERGSFGRKSLAGHVSERASSLVKLQSCSESNCLKIPCACDCLWFSWYNDPLVAFWQIIWQDLLKIGRDFIISSCFSSQIPPTCFVSEQMSDVQPILRSGTYRRNLTIKQTLPEDSIWNSNTF